MCSFCNEEIEMMKHLMWTCKHVSSFWREVSHWFIDLNIILNIPSMKICFGIHDTGYITCGNMLFFILVKKYLYICRFFFSDITFYFCIYNFLQLINCTILYML